MKKIKLYIDKFWTIQKKYNLITYLGMLYLTITIYNLRTSLEETQKKNSELAIKLTRSEEATKNLISNMVIYNRSFESFPLPIWEKVKRGKEFIVQYINPEYEKRYGHMFNNNRFNVIGKNNFELGYPDDIAQIYYENDILVSKTGMPHYSTEYILNEKGQKIDINVVKWRFINGSDISVYGMVLDYGEVK